MRQEKKSTPVRGFAIDNQWEYQTSRREVRWKLTSVFIAHSLSMKRRESGMLQLKVTSVRDVGKYFMTSLPVGQQETTQAAPSIGNRAAGWSNKSKLMPN